METEEILEVGRFLYDNYPEFNRMFEFWQLLSLIDRNTDKVVVVRESGELKGAAMFLKLKDKALQGVEDGFLDIKEPEIMAQLLNQNGENIHFIGVLADGAKTVLKGLRKVIERENPRSVSWLDKDMKLHNVKGLKCHLSTI